MSIDIKNSRVRMAPSPTGLFHIGSARTALFNYLFAKKYGGAFVLRIEDTDTERSKKEFEDDILENMRWLGIDADEDPIKGGKYAPYRQSERKEIYKTYAQKLLDTGAAFYCFHTEEELERERKQQMDAKQNPIHVCEHRDMPLEENKKRASEHNHIIRFKTPAERTLTIEDIIRGTVSFETNLLGDFSIAKEIDTPLYNFAVVVDDALMNISHVIRGEEHISNTPRQILMQEALQFPPVAYAHLPLILAPDRSKLSKRHGAVSIREYRDEGYLPDTLINFISLLGWNPGTDQELFSKEELEKNFSIERVQKSGAIFDTVKLDWMNGEYVRKLTPGELLKQTEKYLPKNYTSYPKPYILNALRLEQPRLKKLSEIGERVDFFFQEPKYDKKLLFWKNMTDEDVKNSLQKAEKLLSMEKEPIDKKALEKAFFEEIGGSDKGILLWPLRLALSGKKASPGPFEIIEILGAQESIQRLHRAEKMLAE